MSSDNAPVPHFIRNIIQADLTSALQSFVVERR